MKFRLLAFLAVCAFFTTSCKIAQDIQPVTVDVREIAVIDNPQVLRDDFGAALESELRGLGIQVNRLPQDATPKDSEFVLTYTANWSWDLAMYLCYAELRVFQKGQPIASAVYDSRFGSANMNKFVKAGTKLRELVGLLFPQRATR